MLKLLFSSLRIIRKYVVYCLNFDRFMLKSYSHEGEDLILNRLFNKKPCGLFVDVGVLHPKRFSNTFIFY